jgi:EAL domain-containing protein (putative c-di-GMP-specific phosphodiesterase class I)
MRDAGIGMYSSKRRGRNCFSFFEQSVREEVVNHINIHQVLMRSVERRDFSFVYQPIAALSTRYTEVEGFEALLRFDGLAAQHSTFDMVVAAEQSGLIVEIGAWALKSACLELKRFRAATSRNLQMSVNVSARQLVDPGFVAMVKRTLAETAVDPSEIALEVTESAIMEDPDRSIMVLEELRNLGMGIHLDDFGTGYSSLSYLRRLPITRVKIDRSFVSADGQSGLVDSVIVGAIISLAHDLKLKVIAEGVETLQQRIALERLRCDAIQGYLISGPVSGLAAAALL